MGTCRREEELYEIFSSISPKPSHSLGRGDGVVYIWWMFHLALHLYPVLVIFLLIVLAVTGLPNHFPHWYLLDNVFSYYTEIQWRENTMVCGNGSRMIGAPCVHSLAHPTLKDPGNKVLGFLFPVNSRTEGRKI